MNILLHFITIFFTLVMSSCEKKDPIRVEPATAPGEEQFSISSPFMTDREYSSLAAKASSGDHDAAFQLYNNFTYGRRNYGLAYYWATKAKALGSTKVTQKQIDLAEKNIFSEASSFGSDDANDSEVEFEDLLK
jgi:hypothetical protein